jgi:uncharacterized protein DUF6285
MKHPPATELLASVARFLRDEVLPSLNGGRAFNLRVSVNAIDLVRREIEQQAAADKREHRRLAKLLAAFMHPLTVPRRKSRRSRDPFLSTRDCRRGASSPATSQRVG